MSLIDETIDGVIRNMEKKQLEWRREQWAVRNTGFMVALGASALVSVLSGRPWWLVPAMICGLAGAIVGLFLLFKAIARKVIR